MMQPMPSSFDRSQLLPLLQALFSLGGDQFGHPGGGAPGPESIGPPGAGGSGAVPTGTVGGGQPPAPAPPAPAAGMGTQPNFGTVLSGTNPMIMSAFRHLFTPEQIAKYGSGQMNNYSMDSKGNIVTTAENWGQRGAKPITVPKPAPAPGNDWLGGKGH